MSQRFVGSSILALLLMLGLLHVWGQTTISPPPGQKDPVEIGETPPFVGNQTGVGAPTPPPPGGDAILTEAGDVITAEDGDQIIIE